MQGVFLNCLLSAVVGCVSAVGTSWYLNASADAQKAQTNDKTEVVNAKTIDADDLVVHNSFVLVGADGETATIELKDGSVFAQNGLYAEKVGAFRILAQKLQTTPDDPLDVKSPVFGELSINQDGGAYLALLSPRESHSVTLGFDKNEKGCIVSQNNDDNSLVAQAVFLKPNAQDSGKTVSAMSPITPVDASTSAPEPIADELPAPAPADAPAPDDENAPPSMAAAPGDNPAPVVK